MVQDAEVDCDVNPRRFDDLIEEQTPGGLNEQVRALFFPRVLSPKRRRCMMNGPLFIAFVGFFQ